MLDAPPEERAPERPSAKPTDLLAGTDGVVDATADEPEPVAEPVTPRALPQAPRPAAEPDRAAPVAARPKAEPAAPPAPKPRILKPEVTVPMGAGLGERAVEASRDRGMAAVQLGAFSTREKAMAAWEAAGAGGGLAGLHREIAPVVRDGRTLYRLRATGVGAQGGSVCDAVRAAGAACVAVK